MKRRSRRNNEENALDLTPMMDIVFIMLIFFIVTTSFVKETGVEVNRPNAETAERDEKGNIVKKDLQNGKSDIIAICINKTIAKIPLLGDILVGDKIGEGVFGVSFKIKGPPKNLDTKVNPIKTLTPRFIVRAVEKMKKKN